MAEQIYKPDKTDLLRLLMKHQASIAAYSMIFASKSIRPKASEKGGVRIAKYVLPAKRLDITGNIHSGLNVPIVTVIGRIYTGGKNDRRNGAACSPQRMIIF